MMKSIYFFVFQIAIFIGLGCQRQPDSQTSIDEEIQIMRKKVTENIYVAIPSAKDFKTLYLPENEFVYYLNSNEQPSVFLATAYLHNRYVLEYRVEFQYERETSRIIGNEEPFLSLSEIVSITREPDGRLRLKHGLSEIIKYDLWIRLNASQGDFASIGIALKNDMPVEGFDAIKEATTRK